MVLFKEKQEMMEALKDEEFYEGDNPLEDDSSVSSIIEEEDAEDYVRTAENRSNMIVGSIERNTFTIRIRVIYYKIHK